MDCCKLHADYGIYPYLEHRPLSQISALPGARRGFCSLFQIEKIGMTACAKSVDLAAKRASQTDLLFFISILLNWLLPLPAQRFQLRAQIVRRVIAAKGLRRFAAGNIGQLNALCHRAAVVHAKHQPGQEIIPCPGLIHRRGLPCREVLRLAVNAGNTAVLTHLNNGLGGVVAQGVQRRLGAVRAG